MSSSTGFPRAGERVQRVEGDVVELLARGGVKRRTSVTRGDDALARPVRVAARSGASWTSLGVLVLARVVVRFIDGLH
jgi:hypothetical protein